MRATLAYTTARILLFVAAAGLLYLAGARGLLLLGLALVVSGIASYVVLSRQRDRMAGALSGRLGSLRSRLDEGTRAEDTEEAAAAGGEEAAAAGGEHPAGTATPRS